jgi:hypothetical protein
MVPQVTFDQILLKIALFEGEPNGIMRLLNDTNQMMYFNEGLGNVSRVHGRNILLGQMFTILEVIGLAFSPSDHHMYFCSQEE